VDDDDDDHGTDASAPCRRTETSGARRREVLATHLHGLRAQACRMNVEFISCEETTKKERRFARRDQIW
jgi:hypothetical protein